MLQWRRVAPPPLAPGPLPPVSNGGNQRKCLPNPSLYKSQASFGHEVLRKGMCCLACLQTPSERNWPFEGNPPPHMAVGQNPVPLVNIKIGGKWMFIHPKMEPLVMPHGHIMRIRSFVNWHEASEAQVCARSFGGGCAPPLAFGAACKGCTDRREREREKNKKQNRETEKEKE